MVRHRNNTLLRLQGFRVLISRFYWKTTQLWLCAALIVSMCLSPTTQAQQVSVAVAANFAGSIKQLKPAFEEETGHRLVTSLASSGTFYAQIYNGAPFDVFLSADNKRPLQLVADGLAIEDSVFTYALGRLTLWSSNPESIDAQGKFLRAEGWDKKGIKRIALANPKTAPYGAAAMEVLAALNFTDSMKTNLVTGQNVAQAFQFIVSGNAQAGFIAQSQLLALPENNRGSHWLIPAELHSPIEQSAVLLKKGQGNDAALAFIDFLKSPKASAIIKASGYNIPNN